MGAHADAVIVSEGASVRMGRQIADRGVPGAEVDRVPIDRDRRRGVAAVQKPHGPGARRREGLEPHLQAVLVIHGQRCLEAEWVLVDRDHLGVREDRAGRVAHAADVVARDERGGHEGPEAEVRPILGVRHASVADLEHVRIVVRPGSGRSRVSEIAVEDADHRPPVVRDVAGHAPLMRRHRSPSPRLVGRGVVARAQNDRAPRGDDRITPSSVDILQDQTARIASIRFDVIRAPGGELVDVLVFVVQAAGRTPGARGHADRGVDPEP